MPPLYAGPVRSLREALGIGEREVVALVGAGGKTTALFRLARELRAEGAGVVVTTTTKIYAPPAAPDLALVADTDRAGVLAATADAVARGDLPVVGRAVGADGKLEGVPPEWVADLASVRGVHHVLVEADGAQRLPVTAPRDHEPVIPPSATIVVPVVGIDAYGGRIADVAHHPELVAALAGSTPAGTLDAPGIARVLLGPGGNTKGAPDGARIVPLVNKADRADRLVHARLVAQALHARGARRVVIAALESRQAVVDVSTVHQDGDATRPRGDAASR